MFEVSEKASKAIKQFLEGREGSQSIRIFQVTDGGWRGPHLALGLDERKQDDQVFTERGVTFLIDNALFDKAKPISIDYGLNAMGGGYTLKSGLLKLNNNEGCKCDNICETCYPHCS